MDDVTSTEVARQLSPVERWFWIADAVLPLNVIARVRVTGHVCLGRLRRAAEGLTAEHPLLRVGVRADADGSRPAFVPSAGGVSIRRLRGDDAHWERHVDEHELGTSVDWHNGPLMRIVDVVSDAPRETHDLLLTASHVIADETTAMTLLRSLVERAANDGSAVNPRPALAAPEDLLPSASRGLRAVGRLAATGLADGFGTALARPCRLVPESTTRRTRLIRRMLLETQLDALARRCRREGVTVHDALAAAMAIVVGPKAAQGTSGRMRIGSPIDFRAELDPPVSAGDAGSYVCTVPLSVRFSRHRDLWSIARGVNQSLDRRRRGRQHLSLLWGMRFIAGASNNRGSRAFALIDRSGFLNVGIWSLGTHDFPAEVGDWQLSGAQFITGVLPFSYFVSTVNTSHGELFWNFTYADGAVSHASAQRLADGCLATVLAATE